MKDKFTHRPDRRPEAHAYERKGAGVTEVRNVGDTWHTFGDHVVIKLEWFERLRREHGERATAVANNTHRIALEHANNERDSWRTRAHNAETNLRTHIEAFREATQELRRLGVYRIGFVKILRLLDGYVHDEDVSMTSVIARAIAEAREVPVLRKQLAEAHLKILAMGVGSDTSRMLGRTYREGQGEPLATHPEAGQILETPAYTHEEGCRCLQCYAR